MEKWNQIFKHSLKSNMLGIESFCGVTFSKKLTLLAVKLEQPYSLMLKSPIIAHILSNSISVKLDVQEKIYCQICIQWP